MAQESELLGGPEHVAIMLVEHDPSWGPAYEEHARRVRVALGTRVLRLEHVGSTAVPGLVAKPVVDVLLVMHGPDDEATYIPALERAGYALRVREPAQDGHRMLRTPQRDMHLHVFPPWSGEVDRMLLLRDLLRSDPVARGRYAARKRELAAHDWPTMQHYADAKGGLIEELVAQARRQRDG